MTRAEVYSKCVERIYEDYEGSSCLVKHILPNEAIDAIIDCAVEEAVKAMEDKTEYNKGFNDAKQEVLNILEAMERSPAYTRVIDGDYIGSVLTNTGIIREKINEL